MKALTVKQPWADLIVTGAKDIENRTWRTNYRGRVLIHAAKSSVSSEELSMYPLPALRREVKNFSQVCGEYCTGAIVGSVEIVDCVMGHPSEWAEPEIWNWVLSNPVKYDVPITDIKGRLSIWDYPLTNISGVPYSLLEYLLSVGSSFHNIEQYEQVLKEVQSLDNMEYLDRIRKVLNIAPRLAEKIGNSVQFFRNHKGESVGTIMATPHKRFLYKTKELSGLLTMLEILYNQN